MSTDEVDGDDLMDGTVLVSSLPLDQSHDHTMEDTTSEQLAEDDDVEESDHSDMMAAKAEATEADTERSQKQQGPLLLKGVSSKKRNVQLFTSPRKRNAAKGGDQGKEGNNPTYHGTDEAGSTGMNIGFVAGSSGTKPNPAKKRRRPNQWKRKAQARKKGIENRNEIQDKEVEEGVAVKRKAIEESEVSSKIAKRTTEK
ncbi:unnamed protein product, partial [Arabidopsis halleri]